MSDTIKFYVKYLLKEIFYLVASLCYLWKLKALNIRLLSQNFSDAFALVMFENNIAILYFGIALILFVTGAIFIAINARSILHREHTFGEIIATFLATLGIVILMMFIFAAINNPILKAIMSVIAGGGCVMYCVTH